MTEAVIRERLTELYEIIHTSPVASDDAGKKTCKISRGTLDDALDQLRMEMKYLTFDLEATRRENRYLRQMFEARFPKTNRKSDSGGLEKS